MDERYPRIEIRPESIHERQRECDLRDEDERRPARLERRGDGLDIDRGLAAARDAVEQKRSCVPSRDRVADTRHRVGLYRQEARRGRAPAAPANRPRRERPTRTLADLGVRKPAT